MANFDLNVDPFGLNKQLLGSSSPYGGSNASSAPKLSKTEMKKIAAEQEKALFEQETSSISAALTSSPFWSEGSTKQKEDVLKYWNENNWKPFAEQKWGPDFERNMDALAYKNAILNPLNTELRQQKKETEGIGPWVSRTAAGTAAALDRSMTATIQGNALGVVSAIKDEHNRDLIDLKRIRDGILASDDSNPYKERALKSYNDRIADMEEQLSRDQRWVDSRADKLRQAQEYDAAADAARVETNTSYRNYQLRGQELDYLYPDSATLYRRLAEEGPLGIASTLASEAIQQAPNMLPPIAGGAVGTVVGGPVGGVIGLGIGSASIVAGSVVNDSADEIFNTPTEILSQTSRYKQLAAEGLNDQQIRERLVGDMSGAVFLPAAALGAATSVLSPEALFLAKSPLNKLLSGQLARRVAQLEAQGLDRAAIQQTLIQEFPKSALRQSMVKHVTTATLLSYIEETGEEGTEQWLQNYGWNVATGDTRDPFEGVRAAAITGGLVSLPIGLVGGVSGTRRNNAAVARYEQQRQADSQAAALSAGVQNIGGINVIRSNPDGTVTPFNITNPDLSPERATRIAEGTQLFREASTIADEIIASQQIPTGEQINNFVNNLYEASIRGVEPAAIETMLTTVQSRAAFPPDSTVNVNQLYNQFAQRAETNRQQLNAQRPVTTYTPRTYEEQRTSLETAQTNIQTELAQLQAQPITDEQTARIATLNRLNDQVQEAMTELKTAQTSGEPNAFLVADATVVEQPQAQVSQVAQVAQVQSQTLADNLRANAQPEYTGPYSVGRSGLERARFLLANNKLITRIADMAYEGKVAGQIVNDPTVQNLITDDQVRKAQDLNYNAPVTFSNKANTIRALRNLMNIPSADDVTEFNAWRNNYADMRRSQQQPQPQVVQTAIEGNKANRVAKLNELRRQQAEGTWTPAPNTQLTPNEVSAVQSENMTVTLPRDADNATTFDYIRNELLNAGRDEEMAAIDAMVLSRMLDTLGSFTGETRAEILQRINFNAATDVNEIVNSYNQPAFVGSPYHFDQFSTDHIGSGEGSQIEGWGLYAAELETVARGYAYREAHNLSIEYDNSIATRTLSGQDENGTNVFTWVLDDGIQSTQSSILWGRGIADPTTKLIDEIASTYFVAGKERGIAHAKNRVTQLYFALDGNEDPIIRRNLTEASNMLTAMQNDELTINHDAQVYSIEIPDGDYVLWDRPISEQPALADKLQGTVSRMLENLNRTITEFGMTWTTYRGKKVNRVTLADITGQDLYEQLAKDLGSPRSASKLLNILGIKGNKYLDGYSRHKGEGTYNFVLFDDQAIKILDTFYQEQGRGRVDFLNDGTARIVFGETADASTAIHEFQHLFVNEALRILNDPTTKQTTQLQQFAGDIRALADLAGIGALENASDPTVWTREAHERVATAFEEYMRSGKAPMPELESLFARMKELLTQLYQRMRDIIREPLSPQVRQAFDNQLTGYVNEQFRQTANEATTRADRRSTEAVRGAEAIARQSGAAAISAGAEPTAGLDATATRTRVSGAALADTGPLAQNVRDNQQVQRGVGERADSGRGGTVLDTQRTPADIGQRGGISETEQRAVDVGRTEDLSQSALADDGVLKPAMVTRREALIREYIATSTVGVEPEAISPEVRQQAETMADYTLNLEFGPTEFAQEAYTETIVTNQQEIAEIKTQALDQADRGIPSAELPEREANARIVYKLAGNEYVLDFENQIDRATYMSVMSDNPVYTNFVTNTTGLTTTEVREAGRQLREDIKVQARHAEPGILNIQSRPRILAEHIMTNVEAELINNPDLRHTAAAQLNGTEEETFIIHSGSMLPEVDVQLDGTRVTDLEGDTALTAGEPPQAIIPVREPTPAEEAVQKQVIMDDIFMLLDEAGVSFEGSMADDADGSFNVSLVPPLGEVSVEENAQAVSQIDRLLQERNTAAQAAIANNRRRMQEMERRTGGLSRTAGRMSNLATAAKEKFVFEGARIEQMFNHIFQSTDGNFDSNAGTQATRMVTAHMAAAKNTLYDTAIRPINEFITRVANLTGFDEAAVSEDIGFARTYLHILESEPLMRIQLEQALQEAVVAGDTRAINNAQAELDAYIAMQTAPDADVVGADGQVAEPVRVRAFGGHPVWEAQQLLNEIVNRYAQWDGILEEGVQVVGNGYNTVTNTAAANGLIDQDTMSTFAPYNFYSALYTDTERGRHAENDIALYMPNQSFHREGSESPAIDSITALGQYSNRVAMGLGQSEFVNQLNLAYEKLMSEGLSPEEIAARWGLTRELYNLERARQDPDIIGKVLVENEDGTANVVRYIYNYNMDTHPEMKRALRSLFKPVKYEGLFGVAAGGTRFMGRLMTYFRPMFPAAVAVRDTIERFSYLPTKRYFREDGSVVSGMRVATKTVAYMMNPAHQARLAKRFITGRANPEAETFGAGMSKLDQRFDEWTNAGGNFNISHVLKKQAVSDVKRNMLKSTWDKSGAKVGEFLNKYSDYFYSQPGFAQFNAMRDLGISVKDSVAGVYELMNMRHRGQWTGKLSWAFPFMNSITQTAGQMMGALGIHSGWGTANPHMLKNAAKGWGMMTAMGIGVSMLLPLLREAMGYDDDFGIYYKMDMIPIGQLSTFLPIPLASGGYFKFPTGFGLSQIATATAIVHDRVSRGVMDPKDAAFAVVGTFAKNIVPNSAPGYAFSKDPFAYIAQTVSPVWLAPVMQVLVNRSFSGSPVSYAKAMGAKDQRLSDTGSLSTAGVWKDGAKLIYDLTGGVVDIAPEQVRTLINGYTSGMLQFIPAIMEGNDFTKVEGFESSRDQLGPILTAMGASVWYGPEVNTTSRAFYDMLEHYNDRIKRAGIGKILTASGARGDELVNYKTQVMLAAGFNPQEITDYLNVNKIVNSINSGVTPKYKDMLETARRANADLEIMKNIYQAYKAEQVERMGSALMNSYYYSPDYQRRWGLPNKTASEAVRSSYY